MNTELICKNGQDIRELRNQLGLKQSTFWKRILVTQSGGSRYETGRTIPKQVLLLIHLAYSPLKESEALLKQLHAGKPVPMLREISERPRVRRSSSGRSQITAQAGAC